MEKKQHILVVDDEQQITQLVETTLEYYGYIVTVANDGESALAMLEDNNPDLILLDIRMSGLDGNQVLKRIREVNSIPVIMLTAVNEKNAIAYSLNLGADDYIEKPFSPRILVARIQAKLRRAKAVPSL